MSECFKTTMIDANYACDVLLRSLAQVTPLTTLREADPAIQAFMSGFISQELRRVGITELRRDRLGNLLGRMPATRPNSSTLLFVIYAMIHPAGTMRDAFEPRLMSGAPFGIKGDVARGRAACEQRGSTAALLAALNALQQCRPAHAEIQVLALTSGETGNHEAAAAALRDFGIRADGAVVAVCSDKKITIGHKGRVDIDLTIEGRAAHSSSPSLGVNAVSGAKWVLDRLETFPPSHPHPLLGPSTLAVTKMTTSPVAAHTIPAKCEIQLDLRLLPGDDPSQKVDDLRVWLSDIPIGTVSVRAGDAMYPCELSEDSGFVRALVRASRDATGTAATLFRMSAASDAGFFNLSGIPAVCYGAGSVARAHTDDDVVAIEDVVEIAAIYAELIRTGITEAS